jgi:hypothetical protein
MDKKSPTGISRPRTRTNTLSPNRFEQERICSAATQIPITRWGYRHNMGKIAAKQQNAVHIAVSTRDRLRITPLVERLRIAA